MFKFTITSEDNSFTSEDNSSGVKVDAAISGGGNAG